MAGILDRYGIKEVADVTFYKIDNAGFPTYPVLYLDTLKVSTIEQTADEATANGGKGNPPLVIWDYNKDITVTLEDALFSAKSLAIMFGDGTLKDVKGDSRQSNKTFIMKTEVFTADGTALPTPDGNGIYSDASGWKAKYLDPNGKLHAKLNPKFYDAEGKNVNALVAQQKFFCTYDLEIENGYVVEVSANSFPGTYYVTGDTYVRSDVSGDDEFFQFIIPKAKVQSENTITLEADGDPSTFNMSLHVMRPEDGVMMKLVKYEPAAGDTEQDVPNSEIYHNHYLHEADDGYTVGTDRKDTTDNGALRIKTLPAAAAYAIDNSIASVAEATLGLELEQYSTSTHSWTAVDMDDVTIKIYNEAGTSVITDGDLSGTPITSGSTKVRFGIGSDSTNLTAAISYKISE